MRIFRKLFSVVRPPEVLPEPESESVPESGSSINVQAFVSELFSRHGATVVVKDDQIEVEGGKCRVVTQMTPPKRLNSSFSLQLDVIVILPSSHEIVESFAGIGSDERSATADALRNFAESSFHVIYEALLGGGCNQVEIEEWVIDGKKRLVMLGPMTSRGGVPENYNSWFFEFEREAKATPLAAGLHWVRVFHGQSDASNAITEVLLDNEPWQSMERELAALEWPAKDTFYTARLFLMIQDA